MPGLKFKSPLLGASVLAILVALSIFLVATLAVINSAFGKIEHTQIDRNSDRAVDELNNLADTLEFKGTDWASWDDTYAFVENLNAAYAKSNLQDNSLQNLGINYMLFINEHQQIVRAKGVGADWSDAPVPASFTNLFKPGSPFLATKTDSETKGFVVIPTGIVQFVALPILTSDGTGPLHGTLVFAYTLTPEIEQKISSLTHISVNYYSLSDPQRPVADIAKALGSSPKKGAKGELVLSESRIAGFEAMDDAYGKPALVSRVEMPREVHAVATDALTRFFWLVAVDTMVAVLILVVLGVVINRKDQTIALKNEFFSIASHELRTPLTVIRDYSQLAKFQFSTRIKEPKFDEMMGNIDKVAAQLIDLVTVFLDAARLEAGKIPFKIEPFSFQDLVKTLLPELSAVAAPKGIAIVADVPANLPLINADRTRVQQVILNLCGNALKFTDTGSITIKAELHDKRVVVYVTDTGRGLDETAQKALFMRFSQVHTKDALHGSGLGLFISKKIIEQMGGTMKLESSVADIGTSLSFSLAVAPAGSTATPAATTPGAAASNAVASSGPTPGVSTLVTAPAPSPRVPEPTDLSPITGGTPPPASDATNAAPPTSDHQAES